IGSAGARQGLTRYPTGAIIAGIHASGPDKPRQSNQRSRNSSGMTPTTENVRPFRTTFSPTTSARPPKRVRQSRPLRTTTGWARTWAFSSSPKRPAERRAHSEYCEKVWRHRTDHEPNGFPAAFEEDGPVCVQGHVHRLTP